uniref:Uncharacterized protein n=1 Tax=Arundo donax TaxID=35708 RepID=A0A0A9HI15_ARUDO
MNPRLPSSIV